MSRSACASADGLLAGFFQSRSRPVLARRAWIVLVDGGQLGREDIVQQRDDVGMALHVRAPAAGRAADALDESLTAAATPQSLPAAGLATGPGPAPAARGLDGARNAATDAEDHGWVGSGEADGDRHPVTVEGSPTTPSMPRTR
jgi:hypothetical protein